MPELVFTALRTDDDRALDRWFDLVAAVHRADLAGDPPVSRAHWVGSVRRPDPGRDPRVVLAEEGDELVGWFCLWLSTTENLDTAPLELQVHPAHRGRGLGRLLLAEAVRRTTELGRTRIVMEAVTGSPGAAFAAAAGARAVLADTQRRLDLRRLDDAHVDALAAEARAHADGYSLVQWVGATPEAHLDGVAALESRMTTDAPFDDLSWEQEVFDAERIRQRDAGKAARGLRSYTTAAVHDVTGATVGFTALVVDDGVDEAAHQWQTIVAPEHRGHRLGMLLKVANLRFLQRHEPAVRTVETWNADSNGPMLRVNLALGFEVVRQWAEWELRL